MNDTGKTFVGRDIAEGLMTTYIMFFAMISAPFLIGFAIAFTKGELKDALWWLPVWLLIGFITRMNFKQHQANVQFLDERSNALWVAMSHQETQEAPSVIAPGKSYE